MSPKSKTGAPAAPLQPGEQKRAERAARRKQAFVRAKKARDARSREIHKRIEACKRREPVQPLSPGAVARNEKLLREAYGDEGPDPSFSIHI